jgi:hypothetical protein
MRLVVRLAPLLCLVAGCGFAKKPYANDPLLRGGRAVSREAPPPEPPAAAPVIVPPRPPAQPTSPRWE